MQTATADPLVGRRLEGRYRIVDRIARGGMSTVYAAVDERLDRMVAVKIMSNTLTSDPAFTDRFAREARTAARLTHLNAVAVYDQGTDASGGEQHVFLVMELVRGRTLRDLIRERAGRFTPAEALSLMQPVLGALSAAHKAGIVHRDVKPENILLSDDGVVKVADFGLARAIKADASATRTGLMMGTVAYCSPEHITHGHADPRSDVYSCGIVLFELLTGRPPYQGDSAMQVAYQHVHGRVPAPSSRSRGVPSEIDELVVLATDPDPDERPADAGEFLAEIADVRATLGLPVTAVPPRPRTAPSRSVGGRSTAATEQLGTARRDGSLGSTEQLGPRSGRYDTQVVQRERARPDGPPPPVVMPPAKRARRRPRRGLVALLVVLLLGVGGGVAAWWYASGRYSTIPRLQGQSQSAAETALKRAGYEVGSITREWSETVSKNAVIGTNPSGGARAERGRAIAIVVSNGPYRITVPSVAKQPSDQAQATLRSRGLQVTVEQAADDHIAAGQAIRTKPAAGAKVKKDQVVTLYISTGPPVIDLPNISPGTPVAEVDSQLQNLGFKVSHTEDFSDSIPKGGVIKLDPSDRAVKFSTIVVTVSKGPQTVTIPDIGNLMPVDQATQKLKSLGLKVKIEKAYGGKNGLVVGMDPPAGTTVDVGTVVTLTII